MIKAQGHHASAIGYLAEQRPSSPEHHIGRHHFALDDHPGFRAQTADGGNTGAVFVAKRQVEEHIFQTMQAQFRQPFSRSGTDAFQAGDGQGGETVTGHYTAPL